MEEGVVEGFLVVGRPHEFSEMVRQIFVSAHQM
jgi:hypothetical protein